MHWMVEVAGTRWDHPSSEEDKADASQMAAHRYKSVSKYMRMQVCMRAVNGEG